MNSVFEKHLEINRAVLVFEKGSVEDKLKFCREYILKNEKPVEKKHEPKTLTYNDIQIYDSNLAIRPEIYYDTYSDHIIRKMAHDFADHIVPNIITRSIEKNNYNDSIEIGARLLVVKPQTPTSTLLYRLKDMIKRIK